MKILELEPAADRAIRRFGSKGATVRPLTTPDGDAHVVLIRIEGGGVLGRHLAAVDQLFVIVAGEGWVSGADGSRIRVEAGAAVFWPTGEEHESGTDAGMTALVVEARRLATRALTLSRHEIVTPARRLRR